MNQSNQNTNNFISLSPKNNYLKTVVTSNGKSGSKENRGAKIDVLGRND